MPVFGDKIGKGIYDYLSTNPNSPYNPTTGFPNKANPNPFPNDPGGKGYGSQGTSYLEQLFLNMQNPNSGMYKNFRSGLQQSLSAAYNPNSLLALTAAMGGSPAQAQEQIKAQQGRINDLAVNSTNQFYNNMMSGSANLLGIMQQDRASYWDMYAKERGWYPKD